MQKYRIDLHNHTPLIPNDYRGHVETSGRDIVLAALAAGLDALAVSDHFAVEYFQEVRRAADEVCADTGQKLLIVPGSELKLSWHGEEVHLITLFPPDRGEELFNELMEFLGIDSSEMTPERLPEIVVEVDPAQVARKVRSLGGICHLAHVDRFFGDYRLMDRAIIDYLVKEAPISAIEIVDIESREVLKKRSNGMPYIQSSDSHSTDEIGRRYTELYMDDLSFDGLKRALISAYGRED